MRTMSADSSAAPLEMPPRAMLTRAAARAGASLTPSPTMPVGPWRASKLGDGGDLVGGQEVGALLADAQLAGHGGGRPGVIAGEHDRSEGRVRAARREPAAASGRGWSARRIQPSGPELAVRATAVPTVFSAWPSSGVKLGTAEAGLVDIAMAAEVILDRVDLPASAHVRGWPCNRRPRERRSSARGHAGRWPCPAHARRGRPARPRSAEHVFSSSARGRRRPRPRRAGRCVSVPVLSKARARSRPISSRYSPPRINTPPRAAAARPLTTATGVAITSAHGQAMTSTTSPAQTIRQIAASRPPVPPWPIPEGGTSITSSDNEMTIGV